MNLRGHRECAECGAWWSYFETGDLACPTCGSVRSVATGDEMTLHTAGRAELDLSAALAAVEDRPVREVATLAAEAARAFLVDRGFVDDGDLQPLDEVTLAAAELRQVGGQLARSSAPDEREEWYLLALLGGAPDGDRPDEVPSSLRAARGRGVAAAVERYRADLVRVLDANADPEARRVLGHLRDHLRRVEALEGDVPVETVDELVAAARGLGASLRDDESGLALAEERLLRL